MTESFLSVTWGDPEMITPDEPGMCGNLPSMPSEAGRQAGIPVWCSVCGFTAEACTRVSCSPNAACMVRVVVHSEMDLSAIALLMRYIVMSAQAEAAKQNDC